METNLILLIILVVALSQVLMVVYFILSNRSKQIAPTEETGSEKNWDLLHEAIKKSQAIVGNAELESIKQAALSQQQIGKFEKESENEMQLSVSEVLQTIKNETAKAGELYKKQLILQSEELKNLSEAETKKMLKDFHDQLEKNMLDVQNGFVRELSEYKIRKEKEIDKNAETIVERTVELYLSKKLDRKEQMQLIFESLERAKAENGFS